MRHSSFPQSHIHQSGATIITFALLLILLLGFVGLALDTGRLYIVKSELQTAMDSCALGGAQELDGKANARTRATQAAVMAANLNRVNMQSATWDDQGKTVDADVEILNAERATAVSDAEARYVRCTHTQPAVASWLLKVMGLRQDDGDGLPQKFAAQRSVLASAVATRGSAQSTCPIPVGLIAEPGSTGPNWGHTVGDWVIALSDTNSKDDSLVPGEMGWFNLDGSKAASITDAQLSEENNCDTEVSTEATLLTPGAKTSVAEQWNYRFGIYKTQAPTASANRPDMTGYAYTPDNWAAMSGAYADFLTKRAGYTPFPDAVKGTFKSKATVADHRNYGYNRRIVLVPVLSYVADRDYSVVDFACMLLLGPMKIYKKEDVYMEYLGNASEPDSPCTTGGKPGGVAGPLVPTLVR